MRNTTNAGSNVTSMVSASGIVPWYEDSIVLPTKGVMDQVAFTASGQDWAVGRKPIMVVGGNEIPDFFAVVRSDTQEALGVVGKDFRELQNWTMYEIGNSLVTEGQAAYETAGVFGNGHKVWCMLRLPDDFEVVKGDKVESFITICNSHDGQSKLRIFPTAIRTASKATLNIAIKRESNVVAVKHTQGMQERIKTVHEVLRIVRDEFGEMMAASKFLANKKMTPQKVDDFIKAMLPVLNTGKKVSSKTAAIKSKLLGFFEYGTGNDIPGVKGSAWAMFNGVVEYVDYQRPTRTFVGDMVSHQRAEALLFKGGQDMKQQAFDILMKI
jgi:phage/plasmid-like protein (TIGR03299 family)